MKQNQNHTEKICVNMQWPNELLVVKENQTTNK